MVKKLGETAPTVNPALVLATGAAELRNVFPAEVLPGVLQAYMWGIKVAFALAIAGSGMSFVFSLFARWNKLNTKNIQGAA
jgi:MFS transporter, DHA2 family, glioxin efflux transporter